MQAPPLDRLGIFLKAPVPGTVKTRLAARVGAELATALYRDFVGDLLEWVGDLRGVRRRIYYSPAGAKTSCAALIPARRARFSLSPQASGGLGRRLIAAFDDLLGGGGTPPSRQSRAVIIGTDCPCLEAATLRRAFRALEDHDLVLGPCRDGGYYLVGLRRPAPALFRRISWSSSAVLEQTLTRARVLGLRPHLLETLGDVDTLDDLVALREELVDLWHKTRRRQRVFPLRTFRRLHWTAEALGAGP